ncbi:uncharacterized protein [Rutidosis leptorrhynchoides]|uniref:uncharacterized protein n=1 Tax=Rutidosis leptorrhynchoides TaxID=125765 RepID=UPI003A993047
MARNNQGNGSNNTNGTNSNNNNQGGCTYKMFTSCKPHAFQGTEGPVGLTRWFEKLESVFRISETREVDKVKFASCTLSDSTLTWWNGYAALVGLDQAFRDFRQRMIEEYCPRNEILRMERELHELKLVGTDLVSYNKRFFELALMCPELVPTERRKVEQYIEGLTGKIRTGVTTSKLKTVQEAIDMTNLLLDQAASDNKVVVETHENRSGDGKRKWNNGHDKNSNQQFHKKQETNKGTTSGPSTRSRYQGRFPLCTKCNRHHTGACNGLTCDKCKRTGHSAKDCKMGTNTCFGCGKAGHYRKDCPSAGKTTEPAKGRAFNINSSEARDDPKLVTGTFLLDNHRAYVFFDSGADRSFVSKDFCHNIKKSVLSLENLYSIELGNGNLMKADQIYRGCTFNLAGKSFSIDKAIRIPVAEDEPLMVYGERSNTPLHFINCLKAQKHIRKGCLAMLVHVSKTEPEAKKLKDVQIVRDFPDVFLEELPGLPPHRDVEFQIDLMPGAAPVARALYRLTPSELQELSS